MKEKIEMAVVEQRNCCGTTCNKKQVQIGLAESRRLFKMLSNYFKSGEITVDEFEEMVSEVHAVANMNR